MSTAIQTILIREHETRNEPKPHTVYKIEIQGPVRGWTVWHRFSEFDDLNDELTSAVGTEPPLGLPSKHVLSIRRTFNDVKVIQERLKGLEAYLRAILSSRDSRWRDCHAFKTFLEVPNSSVTGNGASGTSAMQFTSSSWLDEQSALHSLVRDIKSDINKRNALADSNDVSGSHQSNVQAKKKLSTLVSRLTSLATGLHELSSTGLGDGEVQRRGDMVARLQDECEQLGKMVVAARQASLSSRAFTSGSAAERNPPSLADRTALLGGGGGGGLRNPVTRVFGAAALETETTRPLDNTGLVQLQSNQVDVQDAQLGQLSAILQRQKHIGLAIGDEITLQNELLDRLTSDVDQVGGKLAGAKKQLNRLNA